MLKERYDKHIWKTDKKALNYSFPNIPKNKNLNDIYKNIDSAVKLRNRISHHEPILTKPFRDADRNLKDIYQIILDTLSWICFDTRNWVEQHSNFVKVYDERPNL